MSCDPWDMRLGLAEADLEFNPLAALEVPAPNTFVFNDATVETDKSDGGQGLHGYALAEMLWDRLTMRQAFQVRRFIDNAQAGNGLLFMTIPRNDASASGFHYIDISGRPHRKIDAADSGDIGNRAGRGQQFIDNYTLLLHNVTVINDPSIYTVL